MRDSAGECEILTFTCLFSSAVVFQIEFTFLHFFLFLLTGCLAVTLNECI